MTWPPGLVNYICRFQGEHLFNSVFSSSFCNVLLLNYFKPVIWNFIKIAKITIECFIVLNYARNLWGGVKFGFPERKLAR